MKHVCEKCGKAFDDLCECKHHEELCGLKEGDMINVKIICVSYSDFSFSEHERLEVKKFALERLDLGMVQYDGPSLRQINYDESRMTRQEAFRKIFNSLEREYKGKEDEHRRMLRNYGKIRRLAEVK